MVPLTGCWARGWAPAPRWRLVGAACAGADTRERGLPRAMQAPLAALVVGVWQGLAAGLSALMMRKALWPRQLQSGSSGELLRLPGVLQEKQSRSPCTVWPSVGVVPLCHQPWRPPLRSVVVPGWAPVVRALPPRSLLMVLKAGRWLCCFLLVKVSVLLLHTSVVLCLEKLRLIVIAALEPAPVSAHGRRRRRLLRSVLPGLPEHVGFWADLGNELQEYKIVTNLYLIQWHFPCWSPRAVVWSDSSCFLPHPTMGVVVAPGPDVAEGMVFAPTV